MFETGLFLFPIIVFSLSLSLRARLKSTSLGMPANWRRVCNVHVWPASEVTREVRLTRKQKSSPCQGRVGAKEQREGEREHNNWKQK